MIGKRLSSLVSLLVNEQVQVILCEELLEEIADVTSRPKFARYFPADEVRSLLSFLRIKGVMIEPNCEVDVCRDACDNYLLALAKASKAHYIVTGDRDLLVLGKFGRCKIVAPSEFEEGMR